MVAVSVRCDNRSHDGIEPPAFSVVEYNKQYSDRLDGQRFSVVCFAGDVRKIQGVQIGRIRHTAGGAWIKRRLHCGDAVQTSRCVTQSDLLSVCPSYR